jgi:hypothetical protein
MDQQHLEPNQKNQTIEIVTILSIISSIMGILVSFFYPFIGKFIEFIENSGAAVDEKSMDQFYKMQEMAWPLFGLTLVASILCLVGAVMMRKYKKAGLPLYLVGEWLPVIAQPLLIGFAGIGSLIFSAIICTVFSVLYITNRKSLVN